MKTLLAEASRAFRPFKHRDLTSYPHYDKVVAAMEAAGFPFLGSGGARIVFALSADLVLKVDMDPGAARTAVRRTYGLRFLRTSVSISPLSCGHRGTIGFSSWSARTPSSTFQDGHSRLKTSRA